MLWDLMRQKFGGTSRPTRPCDFVVFSICYFSRFKLWWSDSFGFGSSVFRLHFQVWIDSEGVTIGRFLLFRNSCIRMDFRQGRWSMDGNGIQIECDKGDSRLVLTDKRLSDALSKLNQFRDVAFALPTQLSSSGWETTPPISKR